MIGKKKSEKKSQMALEFVLLFGIAIIIMIILLTTIYELNRSKIDEKIYYKMNDFSYIVQSEFVLASEMNDGYSRIIFIPEKLEGMEYNISISGDSIVFSYNDLVFYRKIPQTSGELKKGSNIIRKINSTIYIEN
ncbi:MAG: hypothetical protein KatS3mg002_1109 [Candidatus Woesearchaeota archaeon]|nr:MAG: hypothetical protein KatS3mg002_1109 [Candidatus Woesearchaeota archaeon]